MSIPLPKAASRAWPYLCFWIVWTGAAIHVWYAFLFGLEVAGLTSGVGGGTPVRGIVRGMNQARLGGDGILIVVLIISSMLALWVTTTERRNLRTILALIPQQVLLLMSTVACLRAIVEGHYADGVTRPFGFIAGDQAPSIIVTVIYSVAIITFHQWRSKYAWKLRGSDE